MGRQVWRYVFFLTFCIGAILCIFSFLVRAAACWFNVLGSRVGIETSKSKATTKYWLLVARRFNLCLVNLCIMDMIYYFTMVLVGFALISLCSPLIFQMIC